MAFEKEIVTKSPFCILFTEPFDRAICIRGGQWLGYSIRGCGDEQRYHPTKVTRCSCDAVDTGGTGHGVRLAPRTAFDERMFRGDQAYARN
jgi:hypothetical protein